jgi:hypothetical protein
MSTPRPSPPLALVGALLFVLAAPALPAAVVTFPYINDFSSSIADFDATGGTWILNTTAGTITNTINTADTSSSFVVQIPKFLSPQTGGMFRLQTSFNLNSLAGTTTTVGFAALGNTPALGIHYLADVQALNNGTLRLFRINPNSQLAGAPWGGGNLIAGVDYTLTLTGTYASNGNLNLLLSLTDGITTGSINSTVLAANVIQGENFGFRDRSSGAGSNLNIDFSYLSITPEPSRPLLLAAALAPLLLLRRRP